MKQTVMIYLEKNDKFLMLHRTKKEKDINKNKYIGVGGHVEENETPNQAVVREVKEETGLDLISFTKSGIVYFILNGYKEEMHIYLSNDFKGEIIECNEGDLYWVNKKDIYSLELWEGDRYFLNKILNGEKDYIISLYYQDDKLIQVEEEAC